MLSVILCTCNGGKYLAEQLESLARQTLLPDELVVSDDASDDDTLRVVQEFSGRVPFAVRVIGQSSRLGVVANFSAGAAQCHGDYIALCDQDDVWLPEKLEKEMAVMQKLEKLYGDSCPLLVHGDLCVVDDQLEQKDASLMRAQGLQDEFTSHAALCVLLVQNYVTGCTILFNRALYQRAWPFPEEAVMHDWWLALVASAVGNIGFVDAPLLLYRQHADNVVGARSFWNSWKRWISCEKLCLRMERMVCQGKALFRVLRVSDPEQPFVERYLRLVSQGSGNRVFRDLGIHAQGPMRNLGIFLLFVFCRNRLMNR